MLDLSKFLKNRKTISIILIPYLLILLTGCTPRFEIISNQNTFRGTESCDMINNIVRNHSYSGLLSFDLSKNTEFMQPYALNVKITSVPVTPIFRDDSYARLHLVKNGVGETMKLRAITAGNRCSTSVTSTGGYFSGGFYVPANVYTTTTSYSSVLFPLKKSEILKIVRADSIYFEIETLDDKPLDGLLSEENIKNIKQYAERCIRETP